MSSCEEDCCEDPQMSSQLNIEVCSKCGAGNSSFFSQNMPCLNCGHVEDKPMKVRVSGNIKKEDEDSAYSDMPSLEEADFDEEEDEDNEEGEEVEDESDDDVQQEGDNDGTENEEEEEEEAAPQVKPVKTWKRTVLAFSFLVVWLTIALSRLPVIKLKPYQVGILEPVVESSMRWAKSKGYESSMSRVLFPLSVPGTIPRVVVDVTSTSSNSTVDTLKYAWTKTLMDSAEWMKTTSGKITRFGGNVAVLVASLMVVVSIYASILYMPASGSLLFATSMIGLYSAMNSMNPNVELTTLGFVALASAFLAALLLR